MQIINVLNSSMQNCCHMTSSGGMTARILYPRKISADFIFCLISPVLLSQSLSWCSWFVLTALLSLWHHPHPLVIPLNIIAHLSSIEFLIYSPIYPFLVRCLVPECLCMLPSAPASCNTLSCLVKSCLCPVSRLFCFF